MSKEIKITLIVCLTIFALGLMAINSWVKIEQTRTMFEYAATKNGVSCRLDYRYMPHCE